jgi:hypothetical protein
MNLLRGQPIASISFVLLYLPTNSLLIIYNIIYFKKERDLNAILYLAYLDSSYFKSRITCREFLVIRLRARVVKLTC